MRLKRLELGANLLGAWGCALGFVGLGLGAFVLGALPGALRRDRVALCFMLANVVGMVRYMLR